MFSCLTNFISIKHHFIRTICARCCRLAQYGWCWCRGTVFQYNEKCQIQWNGTAWWKLDEKEHAKILESKRQQKKSNSRKNREKTEWKKWRIWEIDHISCWMPSNQTDCVPFERRKHWLFRVVNHMHHDPTRLDSTPKLYQIMFSIDIAVAVLFLSLSCSLTCFHIIVW